LKIARVKKKPIIKTLKKKKKKPEPTKSQKPRTPNQTENNTRRPFTEKKREVRH
jgi:hypothetical protein